MTLKELLESLNPKMDKIEGRISKPLNPKMDKVEKKVEKKIVRDDITADGKKKKLTYPNTLTAYQMEHPEYK